MTFAPLAPTTYVPPTEVAPDTFVLHSVQPALGQPLFVYLNSLVIRGAEPMIVDTGTIANRAQWLEDVFSLVEPEDVKWIFLSHDDVDHTGNLDETLSACPNAKIVCSWAMIERHTNCFNFPIDRCRWVTDGESLDIGDRTILALRPPVYDSPTTRGLFDPTTGVYWAVDTFATPLPDPQMGVADLDNEFWQFGMALFALGAVSPWLSMVDETKYGDYVDGVQNLDITTIASCHSPVIEGEYIERAFARARTAVVAADGTAGSVGARPDHRGVGATDRLSSALLPFGGRRIAGRGRLVLRARRRRRPARPNGCSSLRGARRAGARLRSASRGTRHQGSPTPRRPCSRSPRRCAASAGAGRSPRTSRRRRWWRPARRPSRRRSGPIGSRRGCRGHRPAGSGPCLPRRIAVARSRRPVRVLAASRLRTGRDARACGRAARAPRAGRARCGPPSGVRARPPPPTPRPRDRRRRALSSSDSMVTRSGATVAPRSLPALTAMFSIPNTRPRSSTRLRRWTIVIESTSNTTTPMPTTTRTAHATTGSSMVAKSASGTDESSNDAMTVNAGWRTVATRPTNGTSESAPTPIAALSTPTPSEPNLSMSCATSTSSTSSKPRATLNANTSQVMSTRPD